MGEKQAELLAQHTGVAKVIEYMFPNKNAPKPKPGQSGVKDLAAGHTSPEAAAAAINAALMSG